MDFFHLCSPLQSVLLHQGLAIKILVDLIASCPHVSCERNPRGFIVQDPRMHEVFPKFGRLIFLNFSVRNFTIQSRSKTSIDMRELTLPTLFAVRHENP